MPATPPVARPEPAATQADKAGLAIQDIARSSVKKAVLGAACSLCRRVLTAATLKLLDTKYKAHLRTCRRGGPAHVA